MNMQRVILVSLLFLLQSCQDQGTQKIENDSKNIDIQISASTKLPGGNEKEFEVQQKGFKCSLIYPKTSYSKPLLVVLVNLEDNTQTSYATGQENIHINPGRYKFRFTREGDDIEMPLIFPAGIGVTVSLSCVGKKK